MYIRVRTWTMYTHAILKRIFITTDALLSVDHTINHWLAKDLSFFNCLIILNLPSTLILLYSTYIYIYTLVLIKRPYIHKQHHNTIMVQSVRFLSVLRIMLAAQYAKHCSQTAGTDALFAVTMLHILRHKHMHTHTRNLKRIFFVGLLFRC